MLRSGNVRYAVLDLRRNNGGDSFLGKPLLQTLIAFEQADSTDQIVVITSRNTFSAAQILLGELERQTKAIVIGEVSSSCPNFTGEDGERLILPFSKMRINISFKYHQMSTYDDQRPWFPVAIPVLLQSSDYFQNKDPVMRALTIFISNGDFLEN